MLEWRGQSGGEDVVKEHVDEDGGVAVPVLSESISVAAIDERVRVGEGVDAAVKDACRRGWSSGRV